MVADVELCCSVSATGEGKVGNGNHIVLATAPGAVLTSSVPSRLWCAVAGFRSSAPRGEGAERGRRGLKVEQLLRRAVSALQPRQAEPLSSGFFPRPHGLRLLSIRQEEFTLEFHYNNW